MTRRALVVVALLVASCTVRRPPAPPPVDPPPPAPTFTVFVSVFEGDPARDRKVRGAKVRLDGRELVADAAGNAIFQHVQPGAHWVDVVADGYQPLGQQIAVDLHGDVTVPVSLTPIVVAPHRGPPVRVHADGPIFRTDEGAPWRYQGVTAFLLYRRYLDHEDLEPFLRWAGDVGANTLRVFLMSKFLDGGGAANEFIPEFYGDRFFDQLPDFVRMLAARGFYVELVTFADAQAILPDAREQQAHLDRVVAAIRDEVNVFLEVCNEPEAGNGVDVGRVQPSNPGPLLWATGAYQIENNPTIPLGRYGTYHGDRTLCCHTVESAKEGHFYFGGWDTRRENGERSWSPPHRIPWVNGEPIGYGDVPWNRWGDERETNCDQAEDAGAGMALSSAGGTFHSEDLVFAKVPGPRQRECAVRFFAGMRLVPEDVPTWTYAHDGTAAHVLEATREAGEVVSRIHANARRAFVHVANRTDAYRMVPRAGWQCDARNARGTVAECVR